MIVQALTVSALKSQTLWRNTTQHHNLLQRTQFKVESNSMTGKSSARAWAAAAAAAVSASLLTVPGIASADPLPSGCTQAEPAGPMTCVYTSGVNELLLPEGVTQQTAKQPQNSKHRNARYFNCIQRSRKHHRTQPVKPTPHQIDAETYSHATTFKTIETLNIRHAQPLPAHAIAVCKNSP
ncbi:hypothetical protein A0W34_32165 (plasmid) [Rhodococcus sp. BH4]|nr:hypothetical protein A0W34_32165 [Rhodococcus sp. BH4]